MRVQASLFKRFVQAGFHGSYAGRCYNPEVKSLLHCCHVNQPIEKIGENTGGWTCIMHTYVLPSNMELFHSTMPLDSMQLRGICQYVLQSAATTNFFNAQASRSEPRTGARLEREARAQTSSSWALSSHISTTVIVWFGSADKLQQRALNYELYLQESSQTITGHDRPLLTW